MDNNTKVIFYGGTGSVTGANFLVQSEKTKFLVDCGLIQGGREAEKKNLKPFPYNPKDVDYLFVTHAHLDHIGRIPKLVKDGFEGKIISTEETMEVANFSLKDAYKVMLHKAEKRKTEVMYSKVDLEKTFTLWQGVKYGNRYEFGEKLEAIFKDAGHILGSAMIDFNLLNTKIVFTGDLGNSPSPLLPDTEKITDAEYIVMESVYGDRNHESKKDRKRKLLEFLKEGIKKGGEIVIPAFSIERTQVILFELNNLIENGELQSVPVFLDSPLAAKITEIYKKYSYRFKDEVKKQIEKDDIFDFPKLEITSKFKDSKKILETPNPKIVIAGSGMSEGGRVRGHEAIILPKKENTLILVGYQPVGTLGRQLEEGLKKVFIDGEEVTVKAKIRKIEGYSSHKDSDNLLKFVSNSRETLKKVFVVMGEPRASLFLIQRIKDYIGVEAIYPEEGVEYEL